MEVITEVKKGFNKTDVGLITEEWEVKRLGDLFEITSSKRVFQSEWKKKGIPFYRARELAVLGEKGHVDNDLFIDRDLYETHKRSYGVPQKGDLLVTGVGTLGKVYLVPDEEEFYFKDGNIIWYKINGKVNSEFLKQLYSTPLIIDQIKESSAGSTVGTYTITAANNTKIPFPSLEEQKAIAFALSDMDELIRSLDGLIQKKQAIKKGTMQQLLTGKKRLPGFDGEWEVKRLEEFADIQRGASPRPISDPKWFSEKKDIGWVRISDIKGKYLYKTRDYLSDEGMKRSRFLEEGSLIMSIAATVGLPVITRMDLCIHDGFVGFWNLRNIDQEYLYYKLKFYRSELEEEGQTGSQSNINSEIVRNFEKKFPALEEQKAIVQILSDMDRELQTLRQKREKYVQIKQGMMQELLTGKVRLI